MTRRPGLSLIEVLSAIFIMGIGLTSLFTLFPYGALQMAAAIKDDRTAQCASAAAEVMKMYWKATVLETASAQEAFPAAMDDPNSDPNEGTGRIPNNFQKPIQPSPPGTPLLVPPVTGLSDPSYPVVIDPMGWVARAGRADRWWVAESSGGLLPRRNLYEIERFSLPRPPQMPQPAPTEILRTQTYALAACSMKDGLTYAPDGRAADASGLAAEASGGVVQRELRYSWLWVLQRANNSSHRNPTKMTIVVFDKRSHMYAPASAEQVYVPDTSGALLAGDSSIRFVSNTAPPVRKGSWLLDATITTWTYTPSFPINSPPVTISATRNANFYRVVSATENAGFLDVELHQPFKADSKTRFDGNGAAIPDASPNQRRFVLLSGVADVFERTPLANSTMGP